MSEPRLISDAGAEVAVASAWPSSEAELETLATTYASADVTAEVGRELLAAREFQQFREVSGLSPIEYPGGRRLPDAELKQDPAFLAHRLGELEEQKSWVLELHAMLAAAGIDCRQSLLPGVPALIAERDHLRKPHRPRAWPARPDGRVPRSRVAPRAGGGDRDRLLRRDPNGSPLRRAIAKSRANGGSVVEVRDTAPGDAIRGVQQLGEGPGHSIRYASGYAAGGGAFANPQGRLRTHGLVDYPQTGMARASDVLFL
jgi:hypothetical protein